MGRCVEKLPHSCGSSDGLQVFEEDGKYDGYCFVCRSHVPDPYSDKPEGYTPAVRKKRSAEEVAERIKEISSLPFLDVEQRRLPASALELTGSRVGVSRQDGTTPEIIFHPYFDENEKLISYKAKLLPTKKMWAEGTMRGARPFNWFNAIRLGRKRLFITEGEEDCIAAIAMMMRANEGTKYEGAVPAVISLPNGASGAVSSLTEVAGEINRLFGEVVLLFDKDEPGREATKEVILKVFPDALVATMPPGCKDANDALMQGKGKAFVNAALFQATPQKNTSLVWGESLHEKAKVPATWGVSWPWPSLTKRTRGIRKGETIYIGAAPKMGKSEVVDTIAAHLIKEHDWKVLLVKPEQANLKTYKMLAGKMVGKIFHDPAVAFDEAAYERAGEMMRGKVAMLDLYQHLGWETLQVDIRAAASAGVDAVFIDPITNLTNGVNSAEANTMLQGIAQELAKMALDLNIVVFIMCHLRNPENGTPHERGGAVLTSQFAGSRAMGRSCNYMFGLEGNKDPSLPDIERNMRELVLLEDREFGESGRVRMYWDRATALLREV